jgi:antitoxin (DNA-binding transcriptional repressor) of toxin-antitoxin stability system
MPIAEAQERLKELISLAAGGSEVVIVDGSKPVAKLVAIPQAARVRIAGLNAGSAWIAPDFDDPLPDSFWLGSE